MKNLSGVFLERFSDLSDKILQGVGEKMTPQLMVEIARKSWDLVWKDEGEQLGTCENTGDWE